MSARLCFREWDFQTNAILKSIELTVGAHQFHVTDLPGREHSSCRQLVNQRLFLRQAHYECVECVALGGKANIIRREFLPYPPSIR
jgi:hypothetical protein